jgi:penicillin V acylase-like amidase (Ntn superfamily)
LPHVPSWQLLAGSLAIHLTIVDATGAMIVIEFDSLGNLLTKVSPMGVLTNEPQLEVQYALLANYTAAKFQTPGPDFPVPGGFDPVARFQRMALLNYAANYYPYQSESYSPWDGSNVTSGKSQMVQVYNLLNKVSLPLAINYINQLEYDDPSLNLTTPTEKDRTQYLVLRDHTNLK